MSMKKIVIAGGCFWGVEAYFKLIPGIKKTKVGYANSKVTNPTYEEVCSGHTNAVEAVILEYNPKVITLEKILHYLFRIIDPTSLNKQGGDKGTQYRTGVYYFKDDDKETISHALKELQKEYTTKVVVENTKLVNFYDAELYHQDYLTKNPYGYCHVNLYDLKPEERKVNKKKIYGELLSNVEVLFNNDSHTLSVLSNVSALLKEKFKDISWVGFYLDDGQELFLGPFQGKVACEKIKYHQGVCGHAYTTKQSVIVPDVHEFPGHIACDDSTNSELVLPVYDENNTLFAVLDIDSYRYDYFDEEDERYLKALLEIIKKYLRKGEIL